MQRGKNREDEGKERFDHPSTPPTVDSNFMHTNNMLSDESMPTMDTRELIDILDECAFMLCLRIKFHVGLSTIQYTYTYDKVIAYYNNISEIDDIEKIIRYVLHTRAWILLFETRDV